MSAHHANLRIAALLLWFAANLSLAASDEAATTVYLETPLGDKPRVVITADPELDDSNSLVRYLLYTTDFRTEGLIYASSQFHWTGDGKDTTLLVPGREYTRFGLSLCPCTSWRWNQDERFIDDALHAYAQAYPNLKIHNADYPTPVELKSKVRWGNVQFDGDISQDTPGSDLIKSLLLDDEEAPLYLHAWGGQSTIARALKSIEDQYSNTAEWAAIRAKVIRKAVIHPSGDQDDSYGNYIQPHWPEIRYRQQTGGVLISYGSQDRVSESDATFLRAEWIAANASSRGPLGAFLRLWGDGKQMVAGDRFDFFGIANKSADELRKEGYVVWTALQPKGDYTGEGDTGTFVNLIDNGLRGYRGDAFGGWGGYARSGPVPRGFGTGLGLTGERPTQPRDPTHRFFAPMQLDWAARFKWAVTPNFADANHNPRIELSTPTIINAKAGQQLTFTARTTDIDGNHVVLRWWQWREAGSYAGELALAFNNESVTFAIPADAKSSDTFQLIAEATDDGTPMLTRYEKVVIAID